MSYGLTLIQPQSGGNSGAAIVDEYTIANNTTDATNDIDFNWSEVQIHSGGYREVLDSGSFTKRLDAVWAEGTGNGGRDGGSIANTTYHCFAIKKADGTRDGLFSTTLTPALPTGYTYTKRVGSITRAAEAIRLFTQIGKHFQFPTRIRALDGYAVATAGELIAMPVPVGIRVHMFATLNAGWASGYMAITCLDGGLTASALSVGTATGNGSVFSGTFAATVGSHVSSYVSGHSDVIRRTNTSAQIYFRRSGDYNGALYQTSFQVHGYEDFSL